MDAKEGKNMSELILEKNNLLLAHSWHFQGIFLKGTKEDKWPEIDLRRQLDEKSAPGVRG